MNSSKLIELIRNNENFQYIFRYEGLFDNYELFIPPNIIDQLSHIEWIYLTEIPKHYLIGIHKDNQKIYTMNIDCECFYLCDFLFEVPFIFIADNYKLKLHNNKNYKVYLNKMKFYVQWCEKHNIKIEAKYLEILNT